ncbi:MAG: hypothetical protein PHQ40_06630, partial [Anaerolineaceae bacterium]|nr:hypothetical protein [Anaerolineaceae bacterium]
LTGENISRVLQEGEKALAYLPEQDEMRCETAVAMGGAYWALGRVIDSGDQRAAFPGAEHRQRSQPDHL